MHTGYCIDLVCIAGGAVSVDDPIAEVIPEGALTTLDPGSYNSKSTLQDHAHASGLDSPEMPSCLRGLHCFLCA